MLHAGQCKMTVYTYKVCRYALSLVDLATIMTVRYD